MTDLSRLDRLIAYLSPLRGAQRLAARRQIEALRYEGARKSRREEGWSTPSTSGQAEISNDRGLLRDRVRSLLRDNAYAVKATATLVSNRIGTGIGATAVGPNKKENKKLQTRWETWVDRCDANGRTDLYGIQALAERCRIESGEALIQFVRAAPLDEEDVPLRLRVLEPDLIDTTKNRRPEDGNEIREGIEYVNGLPVAYYIFKTHPGDNALISRFSTESTRVPASEMLHFYRTLRPGQLTGVSEFAPVIRRLYDIDGYADAELMRKKIAACAVGVITTGGLGAAATIGPTSVAADGRTLEEFAPGMIAKLASGQSIEFFDPKPSGDYREFMGVELHAIAVGLGIPFELLTGDLSEVNYTSHRGGLVQFRASVEADQWQLIIPQLCLPVWDRFVTEDARRGPGVRVPVRFTPPRFGLLDPAKEIPAMIESIQGGLRSYQDTIRREGDDPEKVLDEIEQWQKDLETRGIVLISNAREKQKAAEAASQPAAKPEPDPETRPPRKQEQSVRIRRIERDADGRMSRIVEEVA